MTDDLPAKLRRMSEGYLAEPTGETYYTQSKRMMDLAAAEIERLTAETEGRWQDMLNTQDRMVSAEERLEAAEKRCANLRGVIKNWVRSWHDLGPHQRSELHRKEWLNSFETAIAEEGE